MIAAPPTAAVLSWTGRKPQDGIKCNKPTGICSYLDRADESRCLERSRTKPSSQSATSSPAAFSDPP
jgi:hypothetical protein